MQETCENSKCGEPNFVCWVFRYIVILRFTCEHGRLRDLNITPRRQSRRCNSICFFRPSFASCYGDGIAQGHLHELAF
jgi:hypothetical protein